MAAPNVLLAKYLKIKVHLRNTGPHNQHPKTLKKGTPTVPPVQIRLLRLATDSSPGSSKNDGAVRALAMDVGCAVCGVALLGMAAGSALGLVYEKVSGGRSGASAKRA